MAPAQVTNVQIVEGVATALPSHPRLLFDANELQAIRVKLGSSASWISNSQSFISLLNANISTANTSLEPPATWAAYFAFGAVTFPITGVNYSGKTKADYEAKAKSLLLGTTIHSWTWGLPLAYDMLYDVLTPAERLSVANKFDNWSTTKPNYNLSSGDSSIIACRSLCAMALKGDGLKEAWADAILAQLPATLSPNLTGMTAAESFISGDTGGIAQGKIYAVNVNSYGGILPAIMITEEAYRRYLGKSRAEHYLDPSRKVIRFLPRWIADLDCEFPVPQTGGPGNKRYTIWKSWASTAGDTCTLNWPFYGVNAMLVGLLNGVDNNMAGLAKWLHQNRIGGLDYAHYGFSRLLHLIFYDDTVTNVSRGALIPRSAKRDDHVWLLRSAWGGGIPEESLVVISHPKWMTSTDGGYQQWAGFEIHRKGPQVVRGGIHGHDSGSNRNTSWNILNFHDTSRTTAKHGLDSQGGYRFGPGLSLSGASTLVNGSGHDLLGLNFDWFVPSELDYIYVDITRAYGSTLYNYSSVYDDPRISSYVREYINLKTTDASVGPVRLIVFDRATTTNTKFEKRWLFRTAGVPSISGHSSFFAGPSRGPLGTHGKTTYIQPSVISAINTATHWNQAMNGRTWLTPVLPEQRIMVKVGGPSLDGFNWRGFNMGYTEAQSSREYESPYGIQGYVDPPSDVGMQAFSGRYRVEIIPSTESLYDAFCNAIEVGDSTATKSQVDNLSTDTMMGAAFLTPGDFCGAVTGRLSAEINSGTFVIPAPGTYKILVAGLKRGVAKSFSAGTVLTSDWSKGTAQLFITTTEPNTVVTVN